MTNGLSFEMIQKAVSGDEIAINRIVAIYEPYINTLSSQTLYDKDGNEVIGVNVDLHDYLRSKLIHVIHTYKMA